MLRGWQTSGRQSGFSLIELLIVISLIAFVYTVAIPQFNLRSGAEVATKLAQIAGDIRGAYDQSVLSKRTIRMVIVLNTGEYWFEEADQDDISLGSTKLDRDPTDQEEKEANDQFDSRMTNFSELAGQAVIDPKSDKEIPPASPVVSAKAKLRRPLWSRIDAVEWRDRTIGPNLMVRDMQSEHHVQKQDLSTLGPDGRAMIYFFPAGYVQKAVIHIAGKKDDMVFEDVEDNYTLITQPYEGVATVEPGYIEADVHQVKDDAAG